MSTLVIQTRMLKMVMLMERPVPNDGLVSTTWSRGKQVPRGAVPKTLSPLMNNIGHEVYYWLLLWNILLLAQNTCLVPILCLESLVLFLNSFELIISYKTRTYLHVSSSNTVVLCLKIVNRQLEFFAMWKTQWSWVSIIRRESKLSMLQKSFWSAACLSFIPWLIRGGFILQ